MLVKSRVKIDKVHIFVDRGQWYKAQVAYF